MNTATHVNQAQAAHDSQAEMLEQNAETGLSRARIGDRWIRRIVERRLTQLKSGRIQLLDGDRQQELGDPSENRLVARLSVNDSRFYRRVLFGGTVGAAESYLQGEWDCDNLTGLFRILCRNLNEARELNRGLQWLFDSSARVLHWLARNTRLGSRRNIAAHYDLGDDFFELFLDPTMMYSSAMFENEEVDLEAAQTARLDRVCQQLDLQPGDHVLEIGTGWGGFAVHAATNYGCRVTTTTISRNQFEYASRRVEAAGLGDRVTVLESDYRDLSGSFDKLVSIEMIEAVGHQYYDTYFEQCGRLLKSGGRMLLQAIVIPDQRYDAYLRGTDFIRRYIFPGGSLPSIGAMQRSVAKTSQLRMVQLQDFADGYARTLRAWRDRFHAKLNCVRELGYTDRFIRLWDYYLSYCEAAFSERAVGVVHAVWERPGD